MNTPRAFLLLCTAAILVGGIGCGPTTILTTSKNVQNITGLAKPTVTPTPAAVSQATATSTPAPQTSSDQPNDAAQPAALRVGPNPADVPQGYNPLTGLPVSDPSLLDLPAVLISITNFPPSSRPQAGLSFSPWVFEMYISEGMTRFLAAFYGDFPHATAAATNGKKPVTNADVGPVRSGRLPYVYIHEFFQDSCLVYAGATYQIRNKLRGCATVFGNDSTNINSAMLDVNRLERIAQENKQPGESFNYTGNLFAPEPAAQGASASTVNVFYSFLNQSQWKFDSASGQYLRFDDYADGSGRFQPATDRLTGQQLAFSNVIVLFAEHVAIQPYIIDIKLNAGEKGKAVVFRDGQRYDLFWTTVSGEYEQTTGLRRPIRFVDANGNPFALKPGPSWVHVVTLGSEVQDKGSGNWLVRFYAPVGAK